MSLVVEGLRSDVIAVGELGDDSVAELTERIAAVLARSAPSRVLDLLSDVATELSADLPEGRVEVRVAGDDVSLSYVEDEHDPGFDGETELSARITLRLSDALKGRLEEGAARQGVSVNSYIVRALERGSSTYRSSGGRGANRLRGYGST
jgi:predicted HicB family RNase H-like nuclease